MLEFGYNPNLPIIEFNWQISLLRHKPEFSTGSTSTNSVSLIHLEFGGEGGVDVYVSFVVFLLCKRFYAYFLIPIHIYIWT